MSHRLTVQEHRRMAIASVLAWIAATILIIWGTAHLAPTHAVAGSFGDISLDNRRIVVMEWIAEGLTHISLGTLLILVTALEGADDPAATLVFRVVAVVAIVLAALTALTGARTSVVWYRVCPVVLSGVAALLIAASLA
jgi:hypothetical protein